LNFGVVVFPGSNCDQDTIDALNFLGLEARALWHEETSLAGIDCVVLPGGFSYGDHLRAGAIAHFAPIMDAIKAHAAGGGLVLGICNGFQILLEGGFLPGAMLRNRDLSFRCEEVRLRVETDRTPFTRRLRTGEVLRMPIAHQEGGYHIDAAGLAEIEENGQVVMRYVDAGGEASPAANPNGSVANIAGVCNREGNVLGLMPHPERAAEGILGSTDGAALFLSAAGSEVSGAAAAGRR